MARTFSAGCDLRLPTIRLQNSDIPIAEGFHLVALGGAEYEPVMLFSITRASPT